MRRMPFGFHTRPRLDAAVVGGAMLMLLARLQAIDGTLYEAADVDGANGWQKFMNVTLPELRYVIGAIFLLRLMWTFNKFDDIFLLTGGGFGTNVLPVLTYQFSFRTFDFGAGAAAAMVLLVILLFFMALYIGIVMRNVQKDRQFPGPCLCSSSE